MYAHAHFINIVDLPIDDFNPIITTKHLKNTVFHKNSMSFKIKERYLLVHNNTCLDICMTSLHSNYLMS